MFRSSGFGFYVRNVTHRTNYGLPILRYLLMDAQSLSNSSYIGYINSDILIHPDTFSILGFISKRKKGQFRNDPVVRFVCLSSLDLSWRTSLRL